ncbi:CASP-like protein 4A1 [Durio zibethinus]|uniref:CASP-like protein n=1 Tax=Durio zibethinus TaxID=66656 RepID=A0A6P5ZDL8_DURZI|nr:CASP-like protein 4A1 [Durio zibethinus]
MEDEKQQQQHQKHPEEEEQKQQQQQQHQEEEEKQQQKEQQNQGEEAENKQNHAVLQFLLNKRSTPPSDHSPVDSPLSSDHSSLSHGFSPPPPTSQPSDHNSKPPAVTVSRAEFTSRDQSIATTVEVEEQSQKLGSGSGKSLRPDLSILRRTKRDKMVRKALLGFRISGFAFCLVSFSVLAADKDQGWAIDSFYHYKEFRYCMAVNVIGFVYSGIQAYDLAYQLTSGKQKPRSRLRCFLDFVLDQMLAYLLISASSSATVRVDDWQSNWGKDKFPEMARASTALSLVAFIALALSSLISGYTLSTFKSM